MLGQSSDSGPVLPKHFVHLNERVLCEALLRVSDKTEVRAKLPHTLVVKRLHILQIANLFKLGGTNAKNSTNYSSILSVVSNTQW